MAERYYVHTFGCQMNVHDSRRIEEVLEDDGYHPAEEAGNADVIVVNTCSVRDKAVQKLLSYLGRLRPEKERGARVVVAGCVAQQEGDALLKKSDVPQIVLGPDNLRSLPSLLTGLGADATHALTEFDYADPDFLAARPRNGEVQAFVTTMKGCDERCTYCIVPHTRGAERYRTQHKIVEEVAELARGGVREITLLGQTVNSWFEDGKPSASRRAPSRSAFGDLMRAIDKAAPELARLRYTSPHPRHVNEDLVSAHRDLDVLSPHVHLPVQSGSDRLLKLMARRYDRARYLKAIADLKQARKGMSFSTDIIVGFPGESKEDFEETMSLVEEAGFVAAFCFKYSPRPFTPALKLGDDVSKAEKEERLERLLTLVDAQQFRHLQSLVGTRAEVLVEKQNLKTANSFTGRTERNEIAHVDVQGLDDIGPGALLEVEITETFKHSLSARATQVLQPTPHRETQKKDEPKRLVVL